MRIAQGLITDFKCESETMVEFCNVVIKALEQEPCYVSKLTQKAYEDGKKDGYVQAKVEQKPILDKIRAEILHLHDWAFSREEILRIIDKYKAESEG